MRLRDYDGRVHFVPNGQVTTVINMSRGFAQAVVDVGVAYRESVDEVMAVMREVAEEMRADPAFAPLILDAFDLARVERWDDSAVVIRGRFRVQPLEQWTVRREYLRRLKNTFDERGIEIPFPHLTVYAGQPKSGGAPPLPLSLAHRKFQGSPFNRTSRVDQLLRAPGSPACLARTAASVASCAADGPQ